MSGRSVAKLAKVVVMLIERPRTALDMATTIGSDAKTVRVWLAKLAKHGLVEVCGRVPSPGRGHKPYLWKWKENRK